MNKQNSNLIIYTERIDYFTDKLRELVPKTNVVLEYLSEERLTEMKGPLSFVHRIKICLIEETLAKYEGVLIYLDSDLLVMSDLSQCIEKLKSGKSLMHQFEYLFSSYAHQLNGNMEKAFYDFYSQTTLQMDTRDYSYNTSMASYNAGVIGITKAQMGLLKDVYSLTDLLYRNVKHHACEQFAFSMVLKINTELFTCENEIYHYWHSVKKQIIDENFNELFQWLKKKPFSATILEINRYIEGHFAWNQWLLFHYYDARKYDKGDKVLRKILVSNPFRGLKFYKDILYHMKRRFLTKNKREPIGFSPF